MTIQKSLSVLFFLLALVSCGKESDSSSSTPAPLVQQDTIESTPAQTPAPIEASTFDVKVKMIGFSKDHEQKILAAVEVIKTVVASDEFRRRVINKKYEGKKIYVDNGGFTNKQVYKKILAGDEKLGNTTPNNTMDLELKSFEADTKTIGYTYPSIKRIYLNRKFLDKFKPHQVAANLFHEWLHKLGFKHEVKKTPSRSHSVPYAIGYIIRDLGKNID